MRNRLIASALIAAMAATAVVAQDAATDNGEKGMPITVVLQGPTSVSLAQITPDGAGFDVDGTDVRLVFTNAGSRDVSFPGEAIMQQVLRRYRDLDTGRDQVFSITEPPSDQAAFIRLGPGESWSYGLWFEYPDQLFARDARSWPLRICALWDKSSLNPTLYPAGSYDWAEGFEACFDVTVQK
ncbi:MAG: hypothetical protein ACRC6I_21900 [Paracoccaceae bacterium]